MSLTKQQLLDLSNNSFPNNNAGAITAEDVRVYNSSSIAAFVDENSYIIDSASFSASIANLNGFSSSLDATFATDAQLNYSSSVLQANINTKLDTASFYSYTSSNDTKWNDLGSKTGSYVTQAVTASSLVTASFSSQQLTFTKGDGSQFSLTIPDVSGSTIDTGSFITTGSINGTQFISGTLFFTGSSKINVSTASFFNYGGGSSYVSLQYEPSNSAFIYQEVNTNLPQFLNQAVKVGTITSGSIVGGFVKVMKNPSLIATGTSNQINTNGLEWVSQSSTDYREWFGYNGNPQNDGETALIVQRGLHKVAGNGLGFAIANAASYSVGTPIYWDGINSTGAMTVVRPTSGPVLRLGYIAALQDDPSNPYVREMWYDPFWEEGETIYSPKISGSVTLINSNLATTASVNDLSSSVFQTDATQSTNISTNTTNIATLTSKTGSYATTGSNTFSGNQTVTGVLQISSSATYDIDITGAFQATANSRVSSSLGNVLITPASVNVTNVTSSLTSNLAKANVSSVDSTGTPTTFKYIAISPNPSLIGPASLAGVTVPSIVTPSGSSAAQAGYIAPIQFQHVGNYTDGRVTVTTPLINSGSVSVAQNKQYLFPSGSNQQTGLATLDGGNPGSVTVSNSLVTANSLIFLTKQDNAHAGNLVISAKSANSFTILSDNNGDNSLVAYMIINPS